MSSFLLVHGSCHGAWCWRDVVPALEALGHTVRAIDLPSHGSDPTPIKDVTLDMYRDAILDAIEEPEIVVGHSMAGFPIAAAAEAEPDKISRLVFLCAYAPISGTSLIEMRKMAKRQPLLDAIQKTHDELAWIPIPEKARETFYHDCPEGTLTYAAPRLVAQAIRPQATALELGANYASVAKSYIRCTDDRTIPPEFQEEMALSFDPENRHEMHTSHSPFFAAPVELAQLLDKIAKAA